MAEGSRWPRSSGGGRAAEVSDVLTLPWTTEEHARRIAIGAGEPSWLLADRLDGLGLAASLPIESNMLFTSYVDLRAAARLADLEPYVQTGDATAISAELPPGAAGLLQVQEDRVVARALAPRLREAGVIVDTFAEVLRSRPVLLERYLANAPSLPPNDRIAQLARGLWTMGAFVYVPAGVQVEAPIVVRWGAGRAGRGLVSRTLVVLDEGATATVLEEQDATDLAAAGQSLWWGTLEVRLAPGARLDVAGLQDFGQSTVMFVNRHATLEEGSSLRWALASVGAQLQKSRIDNVLLGRGATVHQAEIGFGSGSQLFDLTSYTRHIGEDTTGDLLSKGVFLDRARGYFKGLIEIRKSARGTDSFLGEFAMLLAKRARSVAIPSLEIDQPNVRRASHASSVAPIDEAQLFYLQSRGLDRDTARRFIVLGFLEPVVARIPLPEAQDRLRTLLDRKWAPLVTAEAA